MAFVRSILRLEEIDSTSSYARRLLSAGELRTLPALIRAGRQTAGRGRGEHVWWSGDGSLLFTLAFDPSHHGLRPEHEPRLALVAALALIDAIGPCAPGPSPGIRWPNDVEAGGKKLAGILPERIETPSGIRFLLGIGVNVNNDLRAAPESIRAMATSVRDLRPQAPGRGQAPDAAPMGDRGIAADDLLSGFLANFDILLDRLAGEDPDLVRRWNDADTLAGRPVVLRLADRGVAGIARGIDALGGLRIESVGREQTFYGGQVRRDA